MPRGWTAMLLAALMLADADFAAAQARPEPAPQVPAGVRVLRELPFAEVPVKDGTLTLHLDLYLPENAPGPLPVVVWVHGGAWAEGTRHRLWIPWLPQHGYALASIDYRLSAQAPFPAQLADCKAAVRWLRAHAGEYGLDPARFAAAGDSAGGHLAAMLGTTGDVPALEGTGENLDQSSAVQAAVDFFGPADLPFLADPTRHQRPAVMAVRQLLGLPRQAGPDDAEQLAARGTAASPGTYATANDPPFLVVHGEQDPLVPVDQSRRLVAALEKAGVDVTFVPIEGGVHGAPFDDYYYGPEARRRLLEFLDRHLKVAPTSGPASATAP